MRAPIALLCVAFCAPLSAAPPASRSGEGDFVNWFVPDLERATGIRIYGVIDAGYSRNDTSIGSERSGGLTNLPVVGYADEKFELAFVNLFIEKPLHASYIPRITPLPGQQPEAFSFGFNLGLLYGRNGQFSRTVGSLSYQFQTIMCQCLSWHRTGCFDVPTAPAGW